MSFSSISRSSSLTSISSNSSVLLQDSDDSTSPISTNSSVRDLSLQNCNPISGHNASTGPNSRIDNNQNASVETHHYIGLYRARNVIIGPIYNASVALLNVVEKGDVKTCGIILNAIKDVCLIIMAVAAVIALICFYDAIQTQEEIEIIGRNKWNASCSRETNSDVYNYTPSCFDIYLLKESNSSDCFTTGSLDSCGKRIRKIQLDHMKNRRLPDVGVNFIVDFKGNIYEGRGWKKFPFIPPVNHAEHANLSIILLVKTNVTMTQSHSVAMLRKESEKYNYEIDNQDCNDLNDYYL